MDNATTEEIKEGKIKERKDKRAKRVAQLGIVADRITIKIAESMLEHNLLQLGLQQLSRKLMIDFTITFKQAYEQIHISTCVPILDA